MALGNGLPNPRFGAQGLRRSYVVAGLIATALLLAGNWVAVKQLRIRAWPSTFATVTAWSPGIDSSGETAWNANPHVTYLYGVGGIQYESSSLNPSWINYQSQTTFTEHTSHILVGAQVPCWYNPSAPADSYLVNVGVTPDAYVLSIASWATAAIIVAGVRRASALQLAVLESAGRGSA